MCVVVFVRILCGGVVGVVETALLIARSLDVAVVEHVVQIKVDVERSRAIEVDELAYAQVEHEVVLEALLASDFSHLGMKFFLGFANLVEVRHSFVADGRKVDVGVSHIHAIHLEEPHLWRAPLECERIGLLRSAANVEVFQINHLSGVGRLTVLVAAGAGWAVLILIARECGGTAEGD